MSGDLSHVDESGRVRMVDVGGKPISRRRAVARASVRMAAETAARLRDLPKGDALATAELAGVMAAIVTGVSCAVVTVSSAAWAWLLVTTPSDASQRPIVPLALPTVAARLLPVKSNCTACAGSASARTGDPLV